LIARNETYQVLIVVVTPWPVGGSGGVVGEAHVLPVHVAEVGDYIVVALLDDSQY